MANTFSPVSLAISLDDSWYEPSTLVLRAPAVYEPDRSRVVMHETFHWWQQLGHGFMTWYAAEEYDRLCAFEADGTLRPIGPIARRFHHEHDTLGFSARDLHEALTRHWDIHVCGLLSLLDAERRAGLHTDAFWERYDALVADGALTSPDGTGYSDRAFALAMEGPGGQYAEPYLAVLERTSSKVAGIVFPIAAHLAFQTSDPVAYFERFVTELVPIAEAFPPRAVEESWIQLYVAARILVGPLLLEVNEQPLLPIVEIRETGLDDHPGYQNVLAELEYWAGQTHDSRLGDRIREGLGRADDKIVGLLVLDLLFATPGIPDHRGALYQLFPPPVVRFADGRRWLLGVVHRRELHPDWTPAERGEAALEAMADAAGDLDDRWRGFQREQLLAAVATAPRPSQTG